MELSLCWPLLTGARGEIHRTLILFDTSWRGVISKQLVHPSFRNISNSISSTINTSKQFQHQVAESYNMASDAESNKPRTFNPPGVPIPPPTYAQASVTPLLPTSKLITLAGQVGLSAETHKVAEGFDAQVKLAYENIKNSLKAAGATPRDIIHVKHYIVKDTKRVGVESEDELTRVWGHHWIEFMDKEGEGHRPPDTVLGVACLATSELLYECEVWAIVHD